MKRPIYCTYAYLREKLEDQEDLSLRKRCCLAFLKWGSELKNAQLVEFVELALEWRKTEREIGGPRTLLERRARKLIPQVKKWKAKRNQQNAVREIGKKTAKEGKGVHSPERRAKQAEANREMVRKRVASGAVPAKWWVLTPPDGSPPIKVYNLNAFCREHSMRDHLFTEALSKKRPLTRHGWGVERWSPLWEKVSNDFSEDTGEVWATGEPPEGEYPTRL